MIIKNEKPLKETKEHEELLEDVKPEVEIII